MRESVVSKALSDGALCPSARDARHGASYGLDGIMREGDERPLWRSHRRGVHDLVDRRCHYEQVLASFHGIVTIRLEGDYQRALERRHTPAIDDDLGVVSRGDLMSRSTNSYDVRLAAEVHSPKRYVTIKDRQERLLTLCGGKPDCQSCVNHWQWRSQTHSHSRRVQALLPLHSRDRRTDWLNIPNESAPPRLNLPR